MARRTTPPSFLFGLFQGAHSKSETTFVNQFFIIFRKAGLRFFGRASENHAKNLIIPPSVLVRIREKSLYFGSTIKTVDQQHYAEVTCATCEGGERYAKIPLLRSGQRGRHLTATIDSDLNEAIT